MKRSSGAASPHPPTDGPALSVRVEHPAERISVLVLAGELDLSTIPALEGRLLKEIGKREEVIVDLSRLSFIDSSGIGLLIKAHQAPEGGALHTVIASGSQVDRVFEIAGIARALSLYRDRSEALASLDPSSRRNGGG